MGLINVLCSENTLSLFPKWDDFENNQLLVGFIVFCLLYVCLFVCLFNEQR